MKKLLERNEFYILLAIIIFSVAVQLRSGQFFTFNNIIDIVRSMIVPAMLSIGAFLVIVSGGIDVSFTAIACLAMYGTTRLLVDLNYKGSVLLAFIMAAFIGLIMGAFNGFLITRFKLPTLIVTLGTASLFQGIMQGPIKAIEIIGIPSSFKEFGGAKLFTVSDPVSGVTSKMPITVLILIGMLIIAFFIMKYTMLGRSIYAIGGNESNAISVGFKINKIKFLIYCIVGVLAGIAGITRVTMVQLCYPTDLLGMELTVIAAVVLGGANIAGGTGTILGTMLGIGLLTIMQNSLLLLGIPTYWQLFFNGIIIIGGTAFSASQVRRVKNKKLLIRN